MKKINSDACKSGITTFQITNFELNKMITFSRIFSKIKLTLASRLLLRCLEGYFLVEVSEDEEIQEDIKKIQEWSNDEAKKFLLDSDWQVIRHRDQLALGVETSITTEEFQQLLEERQQAREKVYKLEDIKNVTG